MADKRKVLVVDDDAGSCLLVKKSLETTGEFEVTTSQNALEAKDLWLKLAPDVLIMDNVMPGKKGEVIAKELKSDTKVKKLPVIIITGKGEMVFSEKKQKFEWQPNNPATKTRGDIIETKAGTKDPAELAKAYGVDDYISKPFTPEILVQVVKEVLARKRKAAEAEAGDEGPSMGA